MIDLRQNKGFALSIALLFLFLIVASMAIYTLVVINGNSQANRTANGQKAYYVAEAGLVDAYQRITQAGVNTFPSSTCVNASIPTGCAVPFIPAAGTDNGVYQMGATNGNYAVSIVFNPAPRTNYIITSTGTYNKISKTLQLQIIGASVSKWAYWSQSEINPQLGGALWWVGMPGMVMLTDGPVQTNGQLNIFGNPIFFDPVTESNLPVVNGVLGNVPTSNTPNYFFGTANNPNGNGSDPNFIFKAGITNDAPPIDLPPLPTLNAIQTTANDTISGVQQGLVLTGASQVTFNPTGTITVTGNVVSAACKVITAYNKTTIPAPKNGVIYVQSTSTIPKCNSQAKDGNATVQGTVSGQLTVTADQNIYLSGSVAYNQDPRTNPASTDMLGLVANQNITIVEATAPTQLEVAGVMMALQGSFQVDQYWVFRGNASTAVMDQYGSLINYACGATGEMDMSGNLLGGWNQIQSYDDRLGTTMSPPGFPPYVNNAGDGVYTKFTNPVTGIRGISECIGGICG